MEARGNFKIVRSIKSRLAYKFLEFIEPFPVADRLSVMRALVKRFQQQGAADDGEPVSSEDRKIYQQWLDYDYTEIAPGIHGVDASFVRHANTRIPREKMNCEEPKIDRVALRKTLFGRLTELFEQEPKKLTSHTLLYSAVFGNHEAFTIIDTGAKFEDVSYSHLIVLNGSDKQEGLSLLRDFGISGQTSWKLWSTDEIPETVATVSSICERFLEAAPGLLNAERRAG